MRAQLTKEQVAEVRRELESGKSIRTVAAQFGVTKGCIQYQRDVLTGKENPKDVARVQCKGCDKLIPVSKNRKYCGGDCRAAEVKADQEYRLAEFLWIAGTDTPENVTRRLGYGSPRYLARFLFRCGELEWARKFEQAETPFENRRAA